MPGDRRMKRAEGGCGGAVETHQYTYEEGRDGRED